MTTNSQERVLSPQEVRTILNADNREIVDLCKKAAIVPRRNDNGQTYFSQDEVKSLKAISGQNNSQLVVNGLLERLQQMENNLSDSVARVIDEKLDGMDEVVVELIRCKTENENLRQKINELNKENYSIKNKLNSYKSLGLGLYLKKSTDDFSI